MRLRQSSSVPNEDEGSSPSKAKRDIKYRKQHHKRILPLWIFFSCVAFVLLACILGAFMFLGTTGGKQSLRSSSASQPDDKATSQLNSKADDKTTSQLDSSSESLLKHLREDFEAKLTLMDAEEYEYNQHEMENELGCYDKKNRMHRPVYDASTYTILREAYEHVVGEEWSTIGDVSDASHTGFRVPYIAKESPGKGRGIFAEADIPKGTVVYDFSRSAQFWNAEDFRSFLRLIPSNFACDILMWAYVQDFVEDEEDELGEGMRVVVDLDEGALCNDGGSDGNLGWFSDSDKYHPVPLEDASLNKTKRSHPYVALRDIKAGEELLCLYGQFFVGHWDEFGL